MIGIYGTEGVETIGEIVNDYSFPEFVTAQDYYPAG